jgi:hypothetical protein
VTHRPPPPRSIIPAREPASSRGRSPAHAHRLAQRRFPVPRGSCVRVTRFPRRGRDDPSRAREHTRPTRPPSERGARARFVLFLGRWKQRGVDVRTPLLTPVALATATRDGWSPRTRGPALRPPPRRRPTTPWPDPGRTDDRRRSRSAATSTASTTTCSASSSTAASRPRCVVTIVIMNTIQQHPRASSVCGPRIASGGGGVVADQRTRARDRRRPSRSRHRRELAGSPVFAAFLRRLFLLREPPRSPSSLAPALVVPPSSLARAFNTTRFHNNTRAALRPGTRPTICSSATTSTAASSRSRPSASSSPSRSSECQTLDRTPTTLIARE